MTTSTIRASRHPGAHEHVCTVCCGLVSQHGKECSCGCAIFFIPLCCEGCNCRSYEDAHDMTPFSAEGETFSK